MLQNFEKNASNSFAEVSHYYSKLHNILQISERNTLEKIKIKVYEFNNKIDYEETKTGKTIENLQNMIVQLQNIAKSSTQIHLKSTVETAKTYLDQLSHNIMLPKMNPNPFMIEKFEEFEALLKDLCPFKYSDEILLKTNISHMSKNTNVTNKPTPWEKTDKNKSKNKLLESIIATPIKTALKLFDAQCIDSKINSNQQSLLITADNENINVNFPKIEINENQILQAKVSYFNNPTDFYIQFASFNLKIEEITTACIAESEINQTPDNIFINNIYLIKNNNFWQRGLVISEIDALTYKAKLVDTGEILITTKQQILDITIELKTKEYCAAKCCIFAIEPSGLKGWDIDTKTLAESTITKKTLRLIILKKSDNVLYVDLITSDFYPLSFRRALLFTDFAKAINVTDKTLLQNLKNYNIMKKDLIPQITRAFYPAKVDELTKFRISTMNIISPSEFYVIKYGSEKEIDALNLKLNKFYHKKCVQINCPRVNMKCAVKINQNWYRCRVIRVHQKLTLEVFLVDQGVAKTVHYSNLSYLDNSHSAINEYTFRCSLIDIEPLNSSDWTYDGLIEFKRIMQHSNINLIAHSINNCQHNVTLTVLQKDQELNVNALMVKYGHAISTGVESNLSATFFKDNKQTNLDCNQESLASKYQISNSLNFEREEVILTHIVSPGELYLHLKKHSEGIKKLHDYLQKDKEDISNDNSKFDKNYNWKLKDTCLALVSLNDSDYKEWYRALIVAFEKNDVNNEQIVTYTIYLRDQGCILKNISNRYLAPIRFSDTRICNGATKCHLACIKPTGQANNWSKGAIDCLKGLVSRFSNIYATIQGENIDSSIPIILWGLSSEISDALAPTIMKYVNINKTLHNIGFAELFEKFDRDKQVMKLTNVTNQKQLNNLQARIVILEEALCKSVESEEKRMTLDEEELFDSPETDEKFSGWLTTTIEKTVFTAFPTYVDNLGNIYLHDATKSNLLDQIKIFINSKVTEISKSESSTWYVGQPCTARFHNDSLYYRAEILEICKNEIIKVCFIDYGNVEECKTDELINEVFLSNIPRQAIRYELYGIEPISNNGKWTQETLDLIHFLIVMKLCSVNVKSYNDDQTSTKKCSIKVDSYDVAEYLIEKKLAKRIDNPKNFVDEKQGKSLLSYNKYIKYLEEGEETTNLVMETTNIDKSLKKSKVKIDKNFKKSSKCYSDDENEILNLKQNESVNSKENTEYSDIEGYKNFFKKEELNQFYTSALSVSDSGDEIEMKMDKTHYWFQHDEQLSNYCNLLKGESLNSDIEDELLSNIETTFNPIDTSTVLSHFDCLENFKFCKIPYDSTEFYCEVNYIENLTRFYISPLIADLHTQFSEMTACIQEYVKSSSAVMDVQINKPCLAIFKVDNLYYRGVIKKIHSDLKKAEILFVDYFNTEFVSISKLKQCPIKFMNYPLRLLPVELFETRPNPRWRVPDIKPILNDKLSGKKLYAQIIRPGKVSGVQFYESKHKNKLVLQELYEKKLFLKNKF